jgi:hypothetical protein
LGSNGKNHRTKPLMAISFSEMTFARGGLAIGANRSRTPRDAGGGGITYEPRRFGIAYVLDCGHQAVLARARKRPPVLPGASIDETNRCLLLQGSIMNATQLSQEAELVKLFIPYRMEAISIFHYALSLRARWSDVPSMTMHVDDKQIMEGNLNAFTNPAIEAGLVHCRALLEFLGLCDRKGVLSNIPDRRKGKGDVGIESFSNANGPLPMVTPVLHLVNIQVNELRQRERCSLSFTSRTKV